MGFRADIGKQTNHKGIYKMNEKIDVNEALTNLERFADNAEKHGEFPLLVKDIRAVLDSHKAMQEELRVMSIW